MVLWDIWSQKCQLLRVVCRWGGQESISSIGHSMPCDQSSIVIYINSVTKVYTQVVNKLPCLANEDKRKPSMWELNSVLRICWRQWPSWAYSQ